MKVYAFIAVWLGALIALFKSQFLSEYRYFDQQVSPEQIEIALTELYRLFAEEDKVVAIHVLDKRCPCTRFAERSIPSLTAAYSDIVHRVIYVDELGDSSMDQLVRSTPALIVTSNNFKKASYIGPHNAGLTCGKGTSFLGLVLSFIEKGRNPEFYNHSAYGCFCNTSS